MRSPNRWIGVAALAVTAIAIVSTPAAAHDPNSPEGKAEQAAMMRDLQPMDRSAPVTPAALITCTNGFAGQFPCRNVDLLAHLPLSSIGGGNGNSMWGWTDSTTRKEYIIFGRSNGAAFVDVSVPTSPRYLGNLPSHNGTSSSWRDIKVYSNHAFIGADRISSHGMQVFDLTRCATSPPRRRSRRTRATPASATRTRWRSTRRPASSTRWAPTPAAAACTW